MSSIVDKLVQIGTCDTNLLSDTLLKIISYNLIKFISKIPIFNS